MVAIYGSFAIGNLLELALLLAPTLKTRGKFCKRTSSLLGAMLEKNKHDDVTKSWQRLLVISKRHSCIQEVHTTPTSIVNKPSLAIAHSTRALLQVVILYWFSFYTHVSLCLNIMAGLNYVSICYCSIVSYDYCRPNTGAEPEPQTLKNESVS